MTITYQGWMVSFAKNKRDECQALAFSMLAAINQSYPERVK